jgi:hypothetical protein
VVSFDWHGGEITRATPITKSYRNTQNVRRFFKAECGDGFKFDRTFMAWLKDGKEKTRVRLLMNGSGERLLSGNSEIPGEVGRNSVAPSAKADGGLPPAFAAVIRPTTSLSRRLKRTRKLRNENEHER